MDRTQQMKADLEAYRASKQVQTTPSGTSTTRDIKADLEAYRASKQVVKPVVKEDKMLKTGEALGSVFGGSKIGEAIGTLSARAKTRKGTDIATADYEKLTPEMKATLTAQGVPITREAQLEETAKEIKGPTGKQLLGDVGRTALNFVPVGKVFKGIETGAKAVKLGKLATPLARIGTGAGIGYAGDVTTQIAEGKEKPFQAGGGTVAGTVLGALPIVGNLAKKATGLAGEVALGSKGKQAIQTAVKRPAQVEAFSKGKTLQNVATKVDSAVQKFGDDSKKAFNTAIDLARDDVKFTPKRGISEVSNVIKENPLYLEPQEKMVVSNVKGLINKWKDWSPKGIIKLRQEIDRRGFYKDTDLSRNSDKIINSIRKKLNEMAISLDDSIAPALEKASFDIEKAQQLGYNLVGNKKLNVEATANRLKQLLTKIDDPLEKEATKDLLDLLKSRTGVDIASELSALSAYQEFQKPLSSASGVGLVQSLLRKFAEKPAITAGKVKEGLGKIPISLSKKGQISPGDVLFNRKGR